MVGSHALFRGTRRGSHALFRGTRRGSHALFRGTRRGSHALFRGTRRGSHALFRGTRRGSHALFRGTRRGSHALFRGTRRGSHALFRSTRRGSHALFRSTRRGSHVLFRRTRRGSHALFRGTRRGSHALFRGTRRGSHALFRGTRRGSHALFRGTRRGSHALFRGTRRGSHALFRGTRRGSHALFRSTRRGSHALFRSTRRGSHALFRGTRRGSHALFRGTRRGSHALFRSTRRGSHALFRSTRRGSHALFRSTRRGSHALFRGTRRGSHALFRGTRRGSHALFRGTRRGSHALFRGTRRGSHALFRGTRRGSHALFRGTRRGSHALFRSTRRGSHTLCFVVLGEAHTLCFVVLGEAHTLCFVVLGEAHTLCFVVLGEAHTLCFVVLGEAHTLCFVVLGEAHTLCFVVLGEAHTLCFVVLGEAHTLCFVVLGEAHTLCFVVLGEAHTLCFVVLGEAHTLCFVVLGEAHTLCFVVLGEAHTLCFVVLGEAHTLCQFDGTKTVPDFRARKEAHTLCFVVWNKDRSRLQSAESRPPPFPMLMEQRPFPTSERGKSATPFSNVDRTKTVPDFRARKVGHPLFQCWSNKDRSRLQSAEVGHPLFQCWSNKDRSRLQSAESRPPPFPMLMEQRLTVPDFRARKVGHPLFQCWWNKDRSRLQSAESRPPPFPMLIEQRPFPTSERGKSATPFSNVDRNKDRSRLQSAESRPPPFPMLMEQRPFPTSERGKSATPFSNVDGTHTAPDFVSTRRVGSHALFPMLMEQRPFPTSERGKSATPCSNVDGTKTVPDFRARKVGHPLFQCWSNKDRSRLQSAESRPPPFPMLMEQRPFPTSERGKSATPFSNVDRTKTVPDFRARKVGHPLFQCWWNKDRSRLQSAESRPPPFPMLIEQRPFPTSERGKSATPFSNVDGTKTVPDFRARKVGHPLFQCWWNKDRSRLQSAESRPPPFPMLMEQRPFPTSERGKSATPFSNVDRTKTVPDFRARKVGHPLFQCWWNKDRSRLQSAESRPPPFPMLMEQRPFPTSERGKSATPFSNVDGTKTVPDFRARKVGHPLFQCWWNKDRSRLQSAESRPPPFPMLMEQRPFPTSERGKSATPFSNVDRTKTVPDFRARKVGHPLFQCWSNKDRSRLQSAESRPPPFPMLIEQRPFPTSERGKSATPFSNVDRTKTVPDFRARKVGHPLFQCWSNKDRSRLQSAESRPPPFPMLMEQRPFPTSERGKSATPFSNVDRTKTVPDFRARKVGHPLFQCWWNKDRSRLQSAESRPPPFPMLIEQRPFPTSERGKSATPFSNVDGTKTVPDFRARKVGHPLFQCWSNKDRSRLQSAESRPPPFPMLIEQRPFPTSERGKSATPFSNVDRTKTVPDFRARKVEPPFPNVDRTKTVPDFRARKVGHPLFQCWSNKDRSRLQSAERSATPFSNVDRTKTVPDFRARKDGHPLFPMLIEQRPFLQSAESRPPPFPMLIEQRPFPTSERGKSATPFSNVDRTKTVPDFRARKVGHPLFQSSFLWAHSALTICPSPDVSSTEYNLQSNKGLQSLNYFFFKWMFIYRSAFI